MAYSTQPALLPSDFIGLEEKTDQSGPVPTPGVIAGNLPLPSKPRKKKKKKSVRRTKNARVHKKNRGKKSKKPKKGGKKTGKLTKSKLPWRS